jgi:phosphonate transport system ATP-binding protein
VIELDNVTVRFASGCRALDQVSLRLHEGEVAVLLGRSGAGKSTLLRCLNLMTRPTSGTVRANGLGILRPGRVLREHRRRTGMVFQLHQLAHRQTALQNVLIGRLGYHSTLRGLLPLPREEVRLALACLERVGMLAQALQRCDQLSGGERQRVGIARALCQQPRLLLADEPVASLDPVTAREVLALLREVSQADRLTALVSLHQVELARLLGQRVIGLSRGRVVFDGPADALTPEALRLVYEGPADPPALRGDLGRVARERSGVAQNA